VGIPRYRTFSAAYVFLFDPLTLASLSSLESVSLGSFPDQEIKTEEETTSENQEGLAALLRRPALRSAEFKRFVFTGALSQAVANALEEGSTITDFRLHGEMQQLPQLPSTWNLMKSFFKLWRRFFCQIQRYIILPWSSRTSHRHGCHQILFLCGEGRFLSYVPVPLPHFCRLRSHGCAGIMCFCISCGHRGRARGKLIP
jgi:hypothetical protein